MNHPLANRTGIQMLFATFFAAGTLCPDCGKNTRRTSKKWAACNHCPRKRIPRRSIEAAFDLVAGAYDRGAWAAATAPAAVAARTQ